MFFTTDKNYVCAIIGILNFYTTANLKLRMILFSNKIHIKLRGDCFEIRFHDENPKNLHILKKSFVVRKFIFFSKIL